MYRYMPHRIFVRAALVIATLLVAAAIASACGGDSDDGGDPTAAGPAGGDLVVRAIEGPGDPSTAWTYDPAQITVAVGAEVTFTNDGSETHTATADGGSFDTGTLGSGDSEAVTFDAAGSFTYFCSLHPWMKGEIVVTPNG